MWGAIPRDRSNSYTDLLLYIDQNQQFNAVTAVYDAYRNARDLTINENWSPTAPCSWRGTERLLPEYA